MLYRFVLQAPCALAARTNVQNELQSLLFCLGLFLNLSITEFITLPLPYLLEEQPSLLFEPPRRQGKIPLALILARWNRPLDFLAFHCRRNLALAYAAFGAPALAAAAAAAAFVAAASRRDAAALYPVAAAVIKLVAVAVAAAGAGSQLSYSAMVQASGIVIMKVVAGVVTVKRDAAMAGLTWTSVQMTMRRCARGLRTA